MTPTQSILHEGSGAMTAVDKNGRRLLLRRLTALDTLRLFKAAGPVLAQNEPWLSMAGLAFSILEIDGVPIPTPTTESQIESVIDRLGDAGLAAVADLLKEQVDMAEWRPQLGN
jgi:hypothetical protein